MLGDINPQSVRIAQNAVVYPGRNHVVTLTVKRYDGRSYKPVDLDDLTRAVLVFPDTNPTIAFDSATDSVFTWAGNVLTIDLSDYAMPESIEPSHLIVFDAQHVQGQVLVDNLDSRLEFDFRLVSTTGTTPPPTVEFVTEAPQDGETYGRKDGAWVTLGALVSGVVSVNGKTGTVVLDAADVGAATTAQGALAGSAVQPGDLAAVATSGSYTDLSNKPTLGTAAAADTGDFDPAGAATTAVSTHVSDTTPHETLLGVDRVGFDLTAGLTAGSGELVWNPTDATLDLGLPGGSTLQVGQEFLVRGRNTSGTTMVDGTVVYVSGALGARAVFSRAQANQSTADKTIGVITQDLSNNSDGFCTLAGLVRNFDTSGWAEGVELWLSAATAGALTDTKPAPPNNAVRVGQVIRSHATQGQILVRVQIIEALRELHDVNVTAPADGDILVYDSTTQTWLNEPNTGGTGEVNTASNLGAGTGLFAGKVVADLQFKSLVEGTGVTITSDATTVTINASGAGGAVDSVNGKTGVVVLTTTDIAEGTNLYYTNARASAAAPVQSVDGQTGAVSLSSSYAPLSHVGDGGAAHANAVASGAAGFMTGADKAKLDGVAAGATANANTDSLSEGSTNLYFTMARVLATALSGLSLATGGAITSADTVLVAFGKLQKQITDLTTTVNGKQDTLVSATNIKTINGASVLGSGDLTVSGSGAAWGGIAGTLADQTDLAAALAAKAAKTSTRTITGTTGTLIPSDAGKVIICTNAAAVTLTVQLEASGAWDDGSVVHILQSGSGVVTVADGSGITVNVYSGLTKAMRGQYGSAALIRTASNTFVLSGTLGGTPA